MALSHTHADDDNTHDNFYHDAVTTMRAHLGTGLADEGTVTAYPVAPDNFIRIESDEPADADQPDNSIAFWHSQQGGNRRLKAKIKFGGVIFTNNNMGTFT